MATKKTDVVIVGVGAAVTSPEGTVESSPARFGAVVFAPNPVLGQIGHKVKSPFRDG